MEKNDSPVDSGRPRAALKRSAKKQQRSSLSPLLISSAVLVAFLFLPALTDRYGHYFRVAPLHRMDIPDRIPNEYIVVLASGYTIDEHVRNIGCNLSSSDNFHAWSYGYQATMNDTVRDKLVRRDPGVQFVEAYVPTHGIEDDSTTVDPTDRFWFDIEDESTEVDPAEVLRMLEDAQEFEIYSCPGDSKCSGYDPAVWRNWPRVLRDRFLRRFI